jgi:hypothetical protein
MRTGHGRWLLVFDSGNRHRKDTAAIAQSPLVRGIEWLPMVVVAGQSRAMQVVKVTELWSERFGVGRYCHLVVDLHFPLVDGATCYVH